MRTAAGGVVFDASHSRVLLRKPTQNPGFDDLQWTHAKGGIDPGETLEECALREVREEMGIRAKIVAPIDGSFRGTSSVTSYFVMEFLASEGSFDSETQEIRWFSVDQAYLAIRRGTNETGMLRDMVVLKKAAEILGVPNGGIAWM